MKKTKSISAFGKQVLDVQQSMSIKGGSGYNANYSTYIYNDDGTVDRFDYSYRDLDGNGQWDSGEPRRLNRIVVLRPNAVQ
jgi:hypothetical protein